MQEGGYHCPYCGRQAYADQWFTKAQAEYLSAVGMREFAEPLLERLEQSVNRLNRTGSGMISARLERDDTPMPVEPHEPNDMRRVDFSCHPKEPAKVLESWTSSVQCLICGKSAEPRP
jgi:hypothetical protein